MTFARWLYQDHAERQLREWAKPLRVFRFCRAYGGHANDGDSLRVVLACGSEPELREICTRLGLPLTELPLDEPRPVPGQPYPAEEYARFRTPIDEFPQWKQPGHCELRA